MRYKRSLLKLFSRFLLSSTAPPVGIRTMKTMKGGFVRQSSTFRNFVTADGSSGFKAEKNRYHLYVSLACPFACRALIMRKLKGLEDVLPYTVMDWFKGTAGWSFTDQKPKCSLDTVNGCTYLREVYELADPAYAGRWTVPVLWDKTKKTIVNNESSDLMRMLNSEFNAFCKTDAHRNVDLYPPTLRTQIDEANSWIQPEINNGVYLCGFATTQEAYDDGIKVLFPGLEKAEHILSKQRYLTGDTLTEADIRLFNTLVRFDKVYHGHFKCNKKRLVDYENLWGFARDIYQTDGITETVDFDHITNHYMQSHRDINPHGIVSVGPDLDFNFPHGRESLGV